MGRAVRVVGGRGEAVGVNAVQVCIELGAVPGCRLG